MAVCRRLMLLISVNTNGERLSCSNERWRGRPQEVIVGGQINNGLWCDLDKWLSFGSQNTGEPAVAILHTSGYSNHSFSILEIIERGILTAWGTQAAQKVKLTEAIISKKRERISCSHIYSLMYITYFILHQSQESLSC